MSTISWINAAGGDWNVGANWSGGVVPTSGDDAIIALPGTYDILSQSASNAALTMTISDPGASVLFNASTLALGGALVLNAGTFSLGGMIAGGTIDLAGGTFVPGIFGGTLSGVTIEGILPLDMPTFSALSITSGLTLEGAGGSGPGTIELLNGNLDFVGSQIVAGGSIILGQTGIADAPNLEQSGPGALTLAPDMTVTSADIDQAMLLGTVLNQGTVSILGDANLSLNGWLVNAGTLAIAPGGVLTVNGTLTNLATFTGTGGFIDAMGSVTAGDLRNFGSSGAMVVLGSTLDNTDGTLSVGPGGTVPLLTLGALGSFFSSFGEINGGIVQDPEGSLVTRGGTLSAVTYEGTLDVSGGNVTILNGITLLNAAGTAPGVLDVASAGVVFGGFPQTLQGGTIVLGSLGFGSLEVGPSSTLTLGPQVFLHDLGFPDDIFGDPAYQGTVVNQGSILADSARGVLALDRGLLFSNQGTIDVTNHHTLVVAGTLINTGTLIGPSGTVEVSGGTLSSTGVLAPFSVVVSGAGSSLTADQLIGGVQVSGGAIATIGTLSGSASVSNGGVLNLSEFGPGSLNETNATLNLLGSYFLSDFRSIGRGGGIVALAPSATVELSAGTLSVGGTTALGQLRDNGAISDGTIHDLGGGMVFYGANTATLRNVTYQGLLNLAPAASTLTVLGGLSVIGSSGGLGVINVVGPGSELAFRTTQTIDSATINLGNNIKTSTLAVRDPTGTGAALTLGANAALIQSGTMAEIDIDRGNGDALIDRGVIGAVAPNGSLLLQGSTFSNAGRILVANGDTLALDTDSVTNLSGNILNGGYWEVDAGSTLGLGASAPVVNMNAVMVLNGPGSQVVYDSSASAGIPGGSIEQTINYIGPAGVLVVENGRAFDEPELLVAIGKVMLADGSLSGRPVGIASTGLITGFGTVSANEVYDSGHVQARGGALVLNAPLLPGAPAGNALIDAGATLVADQAVAVPVLFQANTGTLALAQASQMSGTISGFTGSDAIDLLNVNPSIVTLSYAAGAGGGVLTVTSGATTEAALRFNGNYVSGNFRAVADGSGGTLILDPPVGPGSAGWTMTPADLQQPPGGPITAGPTNTGSLSTGLGTTPPPDMSPTSLLAHQ